MIASLLANIIDFSLLKQGYSIGLDVLGQFAKVIIEGIGIIGVGIIVFTLVLKAITLPFDIYQRVKMRKQTLIMRQMQPELEKLQKQYANDKTAYSQKMMELYKKNGYNMLGACLPMIISLVILIVAFQGFRAYSNYANLKMYVDMSQAYNDAIAEYVVQGKDYHLPVEGETADELTIEYEENKSFTQDGVTYTMQTVDGIKCLTVESETECILYRYSLENGKTVKKEYKLDIEKLCAVPELKALYDEKIAEGRSEDVAARSCMETIGARGVQSWYYDQTEQHDSHFLWVKNVWYPDVSYYSPIQSYEKFSETFKNEQVVFDETGEKEAFTSVLDETSYNNLISALVDENGVAESEKPNGYYILIILSIGLMVLSQFISMRSQKETNKYQTVDGTGARTQKIMLIAMPIVYAIFAFMYSAAFSIYMVMSSFISICVTLISNLIIGHIFKKKEAEAFEEKHTRVLPWMNQNAKSNKKEKNNRKK